MASDADDCAPTPPATLTNPCDDPRGPTPAAGGRIGRYELGALLGAGGMGLVYRARDHELNRSLAIKLVRHDDGEPGHARVLREAQAMAQLRHPNVVPVFDVGTHAGQVYLVMPLLEGGTLGAWMRAARRPWRDVVARFIAAARGLAAAHAVGLVHRDFKPDNVLLGAGDEVQVADFGLARVARDAPAADSPARGAGLDAQLTATGAIAGTPAYMAPEQLDGGAVDARADQFSFCATLYEALHGQRPFELGDAERTDLVALRAAIRAGRVRVAAPERAVPRGLRALILRGLRDDPAARWPSMAALIAALERRLHRSRRAALLAIAVVGAAGMAAWAAFGRALPEPRPAPTPPSPRWSERPLTSRGDVRDSALSPDGEQVAVLGRGALVVTPIDGGPPRILRRDLDLDADALSWSPDGRSLALLFYEKQPDGGMIRKHYGIIDVATGAFRSVELHGLAMGKLVTATEVVSFLTTRHEIVFDTVDGSQAHRACAVPGDYQWLNRLEVSGGAIYVTVTYADGTRALLVTDRTCASVRVRVARGWSNAFYAAGDGRVFAMVEHQQRGQLIEYAATGAPTGTRRDLPKGLDDIIGIRPDGGIVIMRTAMSWRLVDLTRPDIDLARGTSSTKIALAPDRRRVAVVAWSAGEPTTLHTTDLEHLDALPPPIARGTYGVAWSPDGTRLATCAMDGRRVVVAIVDPAGGDAHDLAAADAEKSCLLAWLDDRRLAYLRTDGRTYKWIDLVDGSTGQLFDPSLGWTVNLAVSSGGTAALHWIRVKDGGSWIVPATGPPYRITASNAINRLISYRWSADGQTLWMFGIGDGQLDRYDLRTGTLARDRTMTLEPDTVIQDVFPLADRLLVQTATSMTDLYLYAAELAPGA